MAELIANNWKAIHDRMEEIKAEQSASCFPCTECGSRGWVPSFLNGRQSKIVGYSVCGFCGNPKDLAPPRHVAGSL
jgi:hypothetical protein